MINCARIGSSMGVYMLPSWNYIELCRFRIGEHKMSYVMMDGRLNGVMLNVDASKLAFFSLRSAGINVPGGYDQVDQECICSMLGHLLLWVLDHYR